MSDWSSQRNTRPWRWAVALIVAVGLIGGAFAVGRSTAPSAAPGFAGAEVVDAGSVSTTAPYPGPSTPSGPVGQGPTGSTPDGGGGWMTPQGGRGHGPAARTAAGVPYGYTQDADGAALAAVNAVVGGLWFNPSFPDPWQALGFLAADPSQVQGNTELTTLVTRGQPSVQELLGPRYFQVLTRPEFAANGSVITTTTTSTAASAAGVFGATVLGVRVTTSTVGGTPTAQATVLWETIGDAGRNDRPVRTVPIQLSLLWQGDWKVADYGQDDESPLGFVLPGVPAAAALPAESWRL
jgi:hypothetical protein